MHGPGRPEEPRTSKNRWGQRDDHEHDRHHASVRPGERRAAAAVAAGAGRGQHREHRLHPHRPGRRDGRRTDRAVRRRRQAGRPGQEQPHGRTRGLRPLRGPLARRHPHVLPQFRRPGHAARRDRPAGARRAPPGTGDAGGGRGRRPSRGHAPLAQQGHARDDEGDRESSRAQGRRGPGEAAAARTRATLTGALDRSAKIDRPRHHDIDWDRTIRANLKNYLPECGTVVPERLIGYGRAARSVKKDVILCIDQSGSMAASVVYASVFGAVLASMRTLRTRLVVFDTAVVDLTDQLDDPVDVLFGTQLGGGTDINRALSYCQSRITRPADTVVVLISDLYEGGIRNEMLKRVAAMKASGVQFVTLLALSDEGAPAYDRDHAAALGALGAPAFACTPDLFPEVMAAAVEKRPLPVPDMDTHR
ncbi:vWA domain-containing protein [Streptomyces sanglieri]|uniref:VWA domain-containing protein n=1 Tax=Streptomyces sanglieri TaxID=193460 RepID=A0ABW2WXG0_9ACTN